MEGNIYINGLIGSYGDEVGTELIDIIQQVNKQKGATSFNVYINSEGGVVDTGFDIYNYLKSLQVPINTIGSGVVASISTVIFMAGDTRVLRPNTDFMIHLPMGGIDGTADEIQSYSKLVRDAENKLISFYKDILNTTDEAITPLLTNETWLTDEQALGLGFTTSANLPMVAKAYFNTNSNTNTNIMTKEDKSFITDWFEKILGKYKKIVNLDLTDANGMIVSFPDLEEGETPKVGDKGTVEGQAAEGSYLIDGQTYVFEGGVVSDIQAATEDGEEELNALKLENEQLKEQLGLSETNHAALLNEVVNLKSKITSRLEVDTKPKAKEEEVQEPAKVVNRTDGILKKLKEKK